MIIIKRKRLNLVLMLLAAFAIGLALSFALVRTHVRAEEPPLTCGDGVCQESENSDLCNADCECHDDGVAGVGEGCGCKDVVCASMGEGPKSACGTHCDVTNTCPTGLSCYKGTCWDSVICGDEIEKEVKSAPKGCKCGVGTYYYEACWSYSAEGDPPGWGWYYTGKTCFPYGN